MDCGHWLTIEFLIDFHARFGTDYIFEDPKHLDGTLAPSPRMQQMGIGIQRSILLTPNLKAPGTLLKSQQMWIKYCKCLDLKRSIEEWRRIVHKPHTMPCTCGLCIVYDLQYVEHVKLELGKCGFFILLWREKDGFGKDSSSWKVDCWLMEMACSFGVS
jgi:hypothetical protein